MSNRQQELEDLLLDEWSSGNFKLLAQEIHQTPNDIAILFKLNKHIKHRIAWRSAYLLDLVHDINPTILNDYLEQLIDLTPRLTNMSIKRHYLRILSQHDLSELADGNLLDGCFEWLQVEETPIAVKAHCMQILYDLTKPYPELIPELQAVLENLLPYGSKGEVNRAKKILHLLK